MVLLGPSAQVAVILTKALAVKFFFRQRINSGFEEKEKKKFSPLTFGGGGGLSVKSLIDWQS